MDIRNFFKAKSKANSKTNDGAGGKSERPSASKKSNANKNSSVGSSDSNKNQDSSSRGSVSNESIRKVTASSPRASQKAAHTENNDIHAKKRRVIDVDSSTHSSGRGSTVISSSPSALSKSSGSKRKTCPAEDSGNDEVVEMSAQEFFKASNSKKKKESSADPNNVRLNGIKDKDNGNHDEPRSERKRTPDLAGSETHEKEKKGPTSKKRIREDEEGSDTDFDPRNDGDSGDDDDGDYEEDEKNEKDDDDEEFLVEGSLKAGRPGYRSPPKSSRNLKSPLKNANTRSTPPSSKKQTPKSKATPSRGKKASAKPEKIPPIEPTLELDDFDMKSCVVPECLQGLTFVFTGILENLSRDAATDLVKCLGGRVTGQVSSKTTYLVVGETLEDGRHYSEGSKYKKATETHTSVITVLGEKKLYGEFSILYSLSD